MRIHDMHRARAPMMSTTTDAKRKRKAESKATVADVAEIALPDGADVAEARKMLTPTKTPQLRTPLTVRRRTFLWVDTYGEYPNYQVCVVAARDADDARDQIVRKYTELGLSYIDSVAVAPQSFSTTEEHIKLVNLAYTAPTS